MPTFAGGNLRYPNLQGIADLFRVKINDSMAGETNTPGEGLIMTNTNPDLLTIMYSGIQDLYSDLRNVGDPALILDNYILEGIPPLAQADPAVQVSLSYAGYYNGFSWDSQWKLPTECERVLRIWERESGSQWDFTPMNPAPAGLPGSTQGARMQIWEMRQNAVWMPGCLTQTDLRLRMRITYPDALGPNINFSTTYVPILSCRNAIVAKMLGIYAERFAPDLIPMAEASDTKYMDKLRLEVVRQQQWTENERQPWGNEATTSFNWTYGL